MRLGIDSLSKSQVSRMVAGLDERRALAKALDSARPLAFRAADAFRPREVIVRLVGAALAA